MIQAITLLVIAALVAIDQVIKVAVVNRFAAGDSMDILFGLIRIRYVENTGAAFSSMQNQTVFLTIFTAVVIVMFYFPAHDEEKLSPVLFTGVWRLL